MRIIDVVNDLRSDLLRNNLLDNDNVTNQHLYRIINNQRNIWLKNEINKDRVITDNLIQNINGLEMEIVDSSTFSGLDDNTFLSRTKIELPVTIKKNNGNSITNIRLSSLISEPFHILDYDRFVYVGNGKFNKRMIYCTLYENRIYIKLTKWNRNIATIDYITVSGIFEDPLSVYKLIYKDKSHGYLTGVRGNNDLYELPYPLPESMWGYIKSTIVEMYAKLLTNQQGVNSITNDELN